MTKIERQTMVLSLAGDAQTRVSQAGSPRLEAGRQLGSDCGRGGLIVENSAGRRRYADLPYGMDISK